MITEMNSAVHAVNLLSETKYRSEYRTISKMSVMRKRYRLLKILRGGVKTYLTLFCNTRMLVEQILETDKDRQFSEDHVGYDLHTDAVHMFRNIQLQINAGKWMIVSKRNAFPFIFHQTSQNAPYI